MSLLELPVDLFRMTHVESLVLDENKLTSLPSEIAQLTGLKELWVWAAARMRMRNVCWLTQKGAGRQQPAQVASRCARPAAKPRSDPRTTLDTIGQAV
jgi:hypothetical protein